MHLGDIILPVPLKLSFDLPMRSEKGFLLRQTSVNYTQKDIGALRSLLSTHLSESPDKWSFPIEMPFIVAPCTNADYPRVFEIFSLAFGHSHPYNEVLWPDHGTVAGRAIGAERMRQIAEKDINTTFVKAIDTDLVTRDNPEGKIAGIAKWNVYDGVIPEEEDLDGPWWDDGKGDKPRAQEMFRRFVKPRRSAIRESGGHLVCKFAIRSFHCLHSGKSF